MTDGNTHVEAVHAIFDLHLAIASGMDLVVEDLPELRVCEVGESYRLRDATGEARIVLAEGFHLVLVSDKDAGELADVVLHGREDKIENMPSNAIRICRGQLVGLVYKEDSPALVA